MIYRWKDGSHASLDAQVVGEELERIRVLRNGRLERDMVVEAARDERSPLHPAFEWNDRVAAEAYRLDQASYLIRSVEVILEPDAEAKPVRAFVSVVRDDDRAYTSVSHAMADADLRRQVLLAALRELEAWRDRYAELIELSQVFAAIEEARTA